MNQRVTLRLLFVAVLTALVMLLVNNALKLTPSHAQNASPAPGKRCELAFPLPRPSDVGAKKFEKLLYSFLDQGCYRKWVADSQIRNTGPFIGGASFGTHNAVKVFYSPEVWDWLKQKKREGELPHGAIIVKKMFT